VVAPFFLLFSFLPKLILTAFFIFFRKDNKVLL